MAAHAPRTVQQASCHCLQQRSHDDMKLQRGYLYITYSLPMSQCQLLQQRHHATAPCQRAFDLDILATTDAQMHMIGAIVVVAVTCGIVTSNFALVPAVCLLWWHIRMPFDDVITSAPQQSLQ